MKTKPNQSEDGITHINVYSKGKTELGRLLSNFACTPFTLAIPPQPKDIGSTATGRILTLAFQSVEAFWYWWITDDDDIRKTSGSVAKNEGRKLKPIHDPPPRSVLYIAYHRKLDANPKIRELLLESTLPFEHYYVMKGKVIVPEEYQWTAKLWEEIREEIKK